MRLPTIIWFAVFLLPSFIFCMDSFMDKALDRAIEKNNCQIWFNILNESNSLHLSNQEATQLLAKTISSFDNRNNFVCRSFYALTALGANPHSIVKIGNTTTTILHIFLAENC